MERLSPRDILRFNLRMVRAVGRGLLQLAQDIRWEHTPPRHIVDRGKSEPAARRIQVVIQKLPDNYWPDAMPDDKTVVDPETGVEVDITYRPFQHDVPDEREGFDLDGQYHHPLRGSDAS